MTAKIAIFEPKAGGRTIWIPNSEVCPVPGVDRTFETAAEASRAVDTVVEAAVIYTYCGVRVIPTDPHTKRCLLEQWPTLRFEAAEILTNADFRKPGAGAGALWGEPSGNLIDGDCDCRETIYAAKSLLPKTAAIYGRPGKPDSHYVFRASGFLPATTKYIDPFRIKRGNPDEEPELQEGAVLLELRSTGSQSLLPPSPHPKGGHYEWSVAGEPAEVDSTELVRAFGETAAAALITRVWRDHPGCGNALAMALGGMWAKNGLSLERATRILEVATKFPDLDREWQERVKTLERTYAKYADGDEVEGFEGLKKILNEEPATLFAQTLNKWLDLEKKRFVFLTEAQMLERPAPSYVVNDILIAGTFNEIIGPWGSGKTFFGIDLGYAVARGRPSVLGHQVYRKGPVVYVVAEGGGLFQYRMMAWRQEHDVPDTSTPFFCLPHAVDLRDRKSTPELLKAIARQKPELVFIDTLARCIPGAEENSAKEMGEAIAFCDDIRLRTGAAVVLLHHPTKKGDSERGSGAVAGAADAVIWVNEVERRHDDSSLVRIRCEKQKDGSRFEPIDAVRRVVKLKDKHGRPLADPNTGKAITSCVIERAREKDLKGSAYALRNKICEFVSKTPQATKNQIAKAVGGKKATVLEQVDKMTAERILKEDGGGWSVLDLAAMMTEEPF
jgi:hypothetical protein